MQTHRFYKDNSNWYIDLPGYILQGGSIGDLQMVEGADTMLDKIAGSEPDVILTFSDSFFEGSDKLELTELCDPDIGGGYYLLKFFEEQPVNQTMWLCAVTEFVFGGMPEQIFIKRA